MFGGRGLQQRAAGSGFVFDDFPIHFEQYDHIAKDLFNLGR